MKTINTDVCVIGAGAGGTGCVYRLIKNGIKTVVVDKNPDFGGTAVFCGVDGWEPGVSLDGIHTLLKDELEKIKDGCHVVERVPNYNLFHPENGLNWENNCYRTRPWGLSVHSKRAYEETLRRGTFFQEDGSSMKRFQFEGKAMRIAINNLFSPYKKNLTTYFGFLFTDCIVSNGMVKSVIISDGKDSVEIKAKYFVDASSDIVLARKAGCAYTFGSEGKDVYNEPCANEKSESINAVTYAFRISLATDKNHIDNVPDVYQGVDITKWKEEKMKTVVSCFCMYPNGDINVNMLPTMEGNEYFALGESADMDGRARVYAYWNYLQTEKGLQGYTLTHIFDAGVRESYRLIGKYVLNENDVRAGINRQPKIGRTVAIADHALDIHGSSGMCRELESPYEIPLECALTNEYNNLFVACRGASFSHIASASVRLTRTMLSFGEGVGEYICELLEI